MRRLSRACSTLRLDRETLNQYELDVVVSVNFSDLNDNRSIFNDVELVSYDKLDMRFVNIEFNPVKR